MLVKRSLKLEDANAICDRALAIGREIKLRPLGVAVLDSGGNIVVLKTEDGSGTLRVEIAVGKAHAALGMGTDSRNLRDRMLDRPSFQNAISVAAQGRYIPVPGGVLIEDQEGYAIGAVGITGDTSEKDEYCAIKAIQHSGFKSLPREIDPNWDAR